jgi:hypothetical protein
MRPGTFEMMQFSQARSKCSESHDPFADFSRKLLSILAFPADKKHEI